jgi:2-hydroxy-6-oxonona-2,4-dienedioate hydrolase
MHARVARQEAPADATDVVLVHGLVVSSTYMQPLIEQLAPHYRVYAPDLPGFGDSGEPGRTLNITELAESLRHWIKASKLDRPLVVGNSFGCQIAVDFAMRYPGLLRGMVLVGPTADPAARNVITQAVRWLKNSVTEPPSLGPTLIRDYAKAGVIRSVRTLRLFVRDQIEEKLPRVAVPVLVVRGGLDPIVPERWANEIVQLLPNAQLSNIPGVGHTANYSASLEIARVTRIFDKEIRENSHG